MSIPLLDQMKIVTQKVNGHAYPFNLIVPPQGPGEPAIQYVEEGMSALEASAIQIAAQRVASVKDMDGIRDSVEIAYRVLVCCRQFMQIQQEELSKARSAASAAQPASSLQLP